VENDGPAGTGAAAPLVAELGSDVHAIDTRLAGLPRITAGYLLRTDRPCLVETGTANSAGTVREALDSLGIGAVDLATIVVTHIHLDHAGGVGHLARWYPNATVVVHESGARHLADPSKLMASARRVFGRVLDEVWGALEPTEAARIRSVAEVGDVDLGGGRRLVAHHTPGHARHHIGLQDSQTGEVYVGDAAGLYVPPSGTVRASTPPPDFDLDLAVGSLRRFAELAPPRLLFAHFGPTSEVAETLHRAEEELRVWVSLAEEARGAGLDEDHAVQMVRERTAERYAALAADEVWGRQVEELASTRANLAGINRWLEQSATEG
jgi:glyoxylase-like metal-dependent hydrolase (beta-lactamase superfamily II)